MNSLNSVYVYFKEKDLINSKPYDLGNMDLTFKCFGWNVISN